MGLPNLSSSLPKWSVHVTIKTVTRTTTNFVEAVSKTTRTQLCVIQPADKRKLNPDTIDWSKSYIQVHSVDAIALSEVIEFEGKDYIVTDLSPYSRYGYTEVTAESTEKALI